MKLNSSRLLFGVLVLLVSPFSSRAQQATANHDVILRRDPSTKSPVLKHLLEGDRLVLVDTNADSGFYHVRTEDDLVGWVYAKFVKVSQATSAPAGPAAASQSPASCDASLWNHVYHSYRLIVKQQCIAVTGTIVDATANQKAHQPDGVRHEPDGDIHGWLKVDPEFENLLNAGNASDEGGNLVFEIVCRLPVRQQDARAACQNYTDSVSLPPVGSHVRIIGSYVQDTFHAQWMEIHPVTSITVIP